MIGTPHRTLPELAAFANSVASRYLEGNDTYPGGGGHPNDNLLPVLAIAQASRASAQTAITAIVLAYEVHRYLFRAFPMRKHALDYVLYNAVASAAGSAKVLGLSLEQTAHAIALAAVPNLGTDISRRGHLTMWKGCAAANAARNGVFAAIMATEGMAGPPTPFEDGLTAVIGAEEICPFPVDPTTFSLLKADYKFFLSEFHAQGPAFLALELRPQIKLDDIEKIEVFTYHFAWFEIGSGAEKWQPTTRETADHSMPYVVAAVLIDGAYTDAIFAPEQFQDRRTLDLMKKIAISEDDEFNKRYPAQPAVPDDDHAEERRAEDRGALQSHRPSRPADERRASGGEVSRAGGAEARRSGCRNLDRVWKFENDGDWASLFDELRV